MSKIPLADSPGLPEGYRLFAFDTIDSTNAEALRRIESDAGAGDVIWAENQSAGRGRRGREWVSATGNLFLTLIVQARDERNIGQLAFVAALGVAGALEAPVGDYEKIRLKWPNDILLDGGKLGGILIERAGGKTNPDLVAVGIGLNVEEAAFPGSACLRDFGTGPSLSELVGLICREFDRWHGRWLADGFSPVRDAWMTRADRLGDAITVRFPDGRTAEGQFRGIDENGALELWQANGTCEMIATGEVFFTAA